MRFAPLLLAAVLACPALAADRGPGFSFPVDCKVGEDCWIIQYFDEDPGPGWRDYACAKRSYDGHTGTDIALRDVAALKKGVNVLAAADGVVAATRDGMPDQKAANPNDPEIRKVGCGNTVVIDHGDGWRTAYCHMKQGSISLRQGDRVSRGQPVGQIGMSGLTEFPHVEFNVVKDRKYVDPFVGPGGEVSCGISANHLWRDDALTRVAYVPVDVRLLAFQPKQPSEAELAEGLTPLTTITPGQRPLVLTMQLVGVRTGDRLAIAVDGPGGASVSRRNLSMPADKIMVTASLPLGEGPWKPGTYTATVSVQRAGFFRKWTQTLSVME